MAHLGWVMFWGATAILTLVMALALYAVYRAPRPRGGQGMILAGGVALPVVVLSALLLYGVHVMDILRHQPHFIALRSVRIEVVGNQWWWDIHYRLGNHSEPITTANELHLPVGFPVTVSVRSQDVIHSFWIPHLAGKIDLIRGKSNRLVLRADRPGLSRGQCAEFCGAQHARMALLAIAESPRDFAAWLARQRRPASPPAQPLQQQGREAVMTTGCLECHTIRGLGQGQRRGPDLTHVGSRLSLAAGSLKNNSENLAEVIAHSQAVKLGNAMPAFPNLESKVLQAMVAYLGSLE